MPPAPAYDHGGVTLITGDVRAVLPTLAAESVQTVVTSPPFFGLRDYGTAMWDGGRLDCDHIERLARNDTERETPGGRGGSFRGGALQHRDLCRRCGARRIDQQIGLEPTPDDYVAELVAVFRDVRRVLRPDGTLWLELGDSYSSGGRTTQTANQLRPHMEHTQHRAPVVPGVKPKDLLGMPWRVALALQADGWWLRSCIIWHKPTPMPEAVRDRPTTAHSSVFLLAAGERYFYDAEAIAESAAYGYREGGMRSGAYLNNHAYLNSDMDYTKRTVGGGVGGTRNARTVWTIPPEPFREAHFATFPQALAERCILAGSRPGDTVLDPFSGAGTVAVVAKRLERRAIGVELNPDYQAMAIRRLRQDVLPLFSHGRSADEPAAVVWHPGQGRLGEDDQLPAAGA